MIELPETYVMARELDQILRGKRVVGAEAASSPHKFAWYSGDPSRYGDLLLEKTVSDADVIGAGVRISLDGVHVAFSTPARYHAPGEKVPRKHQLAIWFEDGSALTMTVTMWGAILCYDSRDEKEVVGRHLCLRLDLPTPLDKEFDFSHFLTIRRSAPPGLSAKALLATEGRAPGIGNGVLQDILWTACIHPRACVDEMSDDELRRLYEAMRGVLLEMVAGGGRDTERDIYGRPGGYLTRMSKNTVGTPCPVCGSTIRKEAYLGGSVYFCPVCQPV